MQFPWKKLSEKLHLLKPEESANVPNIWYIFAMHINHVDILHFCVLVCQGAVETEMCGTN